MTGSWSFFVNGILLLTLAGIAAIVLAYTRAMRAARKHLSDMGSQLLETDDGKIEYARIGDGFPVLVVHGAMGGFDHGLWVAHGFTKSKYQLISVSRFGYLRSSLPPNANLNLQADAFARLLDAMEIPKVIVFAVSAGSTAAIRFTARHPQRVTALVLLGPDSPGTEQMPVPPRFIFDILLRSNFIYWVLITFFGGWMQTMMGLVPAGFKQNPGSEALIKQFMTGALPVRERMDGLVFESYDLIQEFNESITTSSPYPLNKVKVPVLIVHALDDPLAIAENVKNLAELLPNAKRYTVPDGGHFFFGHTAEVTAEILQFVQDHLDEVKSNI